MSRIKNKSTGVIHAGKKGYAHLGLCGADIYSFTALSDYYKVTCKKCIRILKDKERKKKRTCKYSGCTYYSPDATTYCCNACSADAYDDERLSKEKQETEVLRKSLADCALEHAKAGGLNYGLELDEKALKALAHFIKTEGDIYEGTTLNELISQALQNYSAYLEEYHLN